MCRQVGGVQCFLQLSYFLRTPVQRRARFYWAAGLCVVSGAGYPSTCVTLCAASVLRLLLSLTGAASLVAAAGAHLHPLCSSSD
jgi:hypothetical protein